MEHVKQAAQKLLFDKWLFIVLFILLSLGWVMVFSASIPTAERLEVSMFYFATRQAVGILIGLMAAWVVTLIPMNVWLRLSPWLLLGSFLLLMAVLIPGIGRSVNGSMRWLAWGPFTLQPSEIAKFGFIVFLSGYLVRRAAEVQTHILGFVKPMVVLGLLSFLLLLEPDYGAAVVISATAIGLMFLAGVKFRQFFALLAIVGSAMGILAVSSPYRMARLLSFLDPWGDQFNSGYQLTQSLIAFGRGGWLGEGLGYSVQKWLYLPEPHTDFLYAVIAEELGLMGALFVLLLYGWLLLLSIRIGRKAFLRDEVFSGYCAFGIGFWLAFQALVNIGVNVGVLPTKGLTLPLMSYGSSSIVMFLVAMGLLFRIDFENRRRL